MKNKYTSPAIKVFIVDLQQFIMAGSANTAPEDIHGNNEIGNKVQLSKRHSLFDDDEDYDEW